MTRLSLALNEVINAKAAEYGATIIDFYNTTIFSDPATMAEDGVHPNGRGQDIVAQMWLEAIRQALQSPR
jgi:lysophospholipase L1-like esterase